MHCSRTRSASRPTSPAHSTLDTWPDRRWSGSWAGVPGAAKQSVYACIFSYNNEIRVGFKTDVNVIPDIGNLVAAYTAEMEELLALADE